jgi:solute carrier family 32 (vesicular inhibitory amino acid transporter)
MRHPHKYGKALNVIFGFVVSLRFLEEFQACWFPNVQTSIDLAMAIIGYLMYGSRTKDEISTNLLTTEEYPEAVSVIVLILVAIVPLTKFPLKWVSLSERS